MNWKERLEDIALIPWDLYHQFLCKVLGRCHLPLFGVCLYCGKELAPGDYIGWTERVDQNNLIHQFMMSPQPLVDMLVKGGYMKKKRDAEYLWIEAHK